MVAPATNLTMQVLAQCRVEPIVLDGLRPDLCPALEQVILDRMKADRGRKTGSINVGGWKSAEDFFMWPDAVVQELRLVVGEHIGTTRLVGWAMVNRAGSHHPRHQHRVASLFGIYYVTSGSEDAITPTIYECPCAAGERGERYELAIEPQPGRLVIGRGETWHWVPPYPGELPRITVAFDVRR